MGYVKANLPDDVHRALRIEAAKMDKPVEDIARGIIMAGYETYVGHETVRQAERQGADDE